MIRLIICILALVLFLFLIDKYIDSKTNDDFVKYWKKQTDLCNKLN